MVVLACRIVRPIQKGEQKLIKEINKMKKYAVLLTICVIALSGCVGVNPVPRRIAPDLDNVVEHTMRISDNVVTFSLPSGYHQFDYEDFKKTIDINDWSLYSGGPRSLLGGANWDWQPRTNVNGTLKLSFWMEKLGEGETLSKALHSKFIGDKDFRLKKSFRFIEGNPKWIMLDFKGSDFSEDMEVFLFPLDNDHYLRVQFIATDNSHGKPENQYWYAQAEDMVDQIMASITIDTGAEAATIPYGVPDLGLVKPGTLKYFDDISVR